MNIPHSHPDVYELTIIRGPRAPLGAPPRFLVEVPHGATRTAEFAVLALRLHGPFPEGLVDFFHVNTDAGAPELALAVAERVAGEDGVALVLRSRVPRTFVDCNRVIASSAADFRAGKVTPGVPPYVTHPADLTLLHELHAAYLAAAEACFEAVCAQGGHALLLHTYAPRSVDVEVDHHIVPSLRRAWHPDVEPTWPLRPEIDVIAKAPDGTAMVPAHLLAALRAGLAPLHVGESETYPLSPVTQAWRFATLHPGQILCMEVRRDLLADPFSPFEQMVISPAKVARLADPIASAIARW